MTIQSPVKERLLSDIRKDADSHGRTSLTASALARRFGLSAHDAQKNLYQLEKEGFLRLDSGRNGAEAGMEIKRIRLRRSHLNDSVLRRRPASVTDRVRQWIISAPSQRDGWIHVTPNQIRDKLGVEGGAVSVAISGLQQGGEAEVRKEGMRIVAVRMLPKQAPAAPASPEPEAREDDGPTHVEMVDGEYTRVPGLAPIEMPETPELDRYAVARRVYGLAPTDSPYLRVEFTANPVADEAVKLRDALRTALERLQGGTITGTKGGASHGEDESERPVA